MLIKQNAAKNLMIFVSDSNDHVTGKPGATLSVTISKDGAAFAAITPTITDRGNGWYNVVLTAAHTNTLGPLALHASASGCDPVDLIREVVACDLADGNRLGLASLPNVGPNAVGGLPIIATGGLLDYTVAGLSGYVAPPSASSVAGAVRTELTTELGRIDATFTTTINARTWSGGELSQIRHRLGIDGTATQPLATPSLSTLSAPGVWGHGTRSLTETVNVGEKTGFKLASDGLDQIGAGIPNGVGTTFATKLMQLYGRFFGKTDRTGSLIRTYRSDGTTINTSQTWTDSGGVQTVGAAT